jgi:hypothetical protein
VPVWLRSEAGTLHTNDVEQQELLLSAQSHRASKKNRAAYAGGYAPQTSFEASNYLCAISTHPANNATKPNRHICSMQVLCMSG